jgi:hypothetical protein
MATRPLILLWVALGRSGGRPAVVAGLTFLAVTRVMVRQVIYLP